MVDTNCIPSIVLPLNLSRCYAPTTHLGLNVAHLKLILIEDNPIDRLDCMIAIKL